MSLLRRPIFTVITLLSFTLPVEAFFEAGAGFTSFTSGRTVPGAALALHFGNLGFSGFATGVQTKSYYHSGYMLSGYQVVLDEDAYWGKLRGELGLGAFYAQHGYRSDSALSPSKNEDGGVGPAARASFELFPHFRINAEVLLATSSSLNFIFLSFQDIAMVSVTCEL